MATEQQFAFFRAMHDAEEVRYNQLQDKARFYFGVSSAFLGAVAFSLADIAAFAKQYDIPVIFFLIVAIGMAISVVFTVLAMGIRGYERVADPRRIIDSMVESVQSDDAFRDDRIVDFAAATIFNSKVNGRTANFLRYAGVTIVVSIAAQMAILIWAALTIL